MWSTLSDVWVYLVAKRQIFYELCLNNYEQCGNSLKILEEIAKFIRDIYNGKFLISIKNTAIILKLYLSVLLSVSYRISIITN